MGLKVGDVVRLKSGGPVMTIRKYPHKINSEDFAECIWFADDMGVKVISFPPDTLENIEDGEKAEEE